jgi:Tfp pilus assembly protein PilX
MRSSPIVVPKDRRGMSFCYAMIVLTAMLVLGSVFLHIGLNSAKWAYSHYQQERAFYLAESALDRACWMIQKDSAGAGGINNALSLTDTEVAAGQTRTFQSPTWQTADGAYSFRAVAPHKQIPGTVEIYATGTSAGGGAVQEATFTILRPNRDINTTDTSFTAATCFSHAILSGHNLTISGSPQVVGGGVHVNGNLHFNGEASSVDGNITATGTISGNCTQPAGAERTELADPVSLPMLSMPFYLAQAQAGGQELGTSDTSKVTLAGASAPLGTFEAPKIIFVHGYLKLSGILSGVGIIAATRGIEITGNVDYYNSDSMWALITPGTFKMTGTTHVTGSIYCHNGTGSAEFIGSGTPNVLGGVVADVITMTGDYTVQHDARVMGLHEMPGAIVDFGPPVVQTLAWTRKHAG